MQTPTNEGRIRSHIKACSEISDQLQRQSYVQTAGRNLTVHIDTQSRLYPILQREAIRTMPLEPNETARAIHEDSQISKESSFQQELYQFGMHSFNPKYEPKYDPIPTKDSNCSHIPLTRCRYSLFANAEDKAEGIEQAKRYRTNS